MGVGGFDRATAGGTRAAGAVGSRSRLKAWWLEQAWLRKEPSQPPGQLHRPLIPPSGIRRVERLLAAQPTTHTDTTSISNVVLAAL